MKQGPDREYKQETRVAIIYKLVIKVKNMTEAL